MTEKQACALLKARFEKAGFTIAENVGFDENGVKFEVDGFDAKKRVGYEYLTEEAGDSWDVDGSVVAALEARRDSGDLFILVVDEKDAADEAALGRAADVFLEQLGEVASSDDVELVDDDGDDDDDDKPAAKKSTAKAVAKKPAAKRAAKPTKSPPKPPPSPKPKAKKK